MNKLYDENITLLDPEHKYLLATDPSIKFKSVTQIIGEYFEPFDKFAVANKLVTTYPKYMGMNVDELIVQWDATADQGTKVHKEIEIYINAGKPSTEIKAAKGIEWIRPYQDNPDKDIYSEVIIYNKTLKIAGSIDIVIYDKSSNSYEIIDWKTSKEIETTSFKGKTGTHSITSHLIDCRFVHYSLQLSFYRYIMEKYYGLNIDNHSIAHLNEEQCAIYKGEYYRDEVKKIILDQQSIK